jgi:hypothetical protein
MPARKFIAAAALLMVAAPARADDDTIEKVVQHCVDVVHNFHADDAMSQKFYTHFDAYYNRSTKRVIDNVVVNGDLPPRFQFGKCMASAGLPLGN